MILRQLIITVLVWIAVTNLFVLGLALESFAMRSLSVILGIALALTFMVLREQK